MYWTYWTYWTHWTHEKVTANEESEDITNLNSVIIDQIQALHDKNQEILDLLSSISSDGSGVIPYIINTQIVARDRIEISKQVLNSIHQSMSMAHTKKKKKNNVDKVLKNAEKKVLNGIEFGSSLQELIDQADNEIESIKQKKF